MMLRMQLTYRDSGGDGGVVGDVDIAVDVRLKEVQLTKGMR